MGAVVEMLGSFAIAMLIPRWLVFACAFAGMLMVLWGMAGITLFAVHKVSGWLLRTRFGVASGTEPHQRAPGGGRRSMKPTKPSASTKPIERPAVSVLPEGKSVQQRLVELGVGKGWKLKVTLPKLPRKTLTMDASEKSEQPRPPSGQYQCPEEGLHPGRGPLPGTYDPPPPYFGSIPTKPAKAGGPRSRRASRHCARSRHPSRP